jgi:hypothetical protein
MSEIKIRKGRVIILEPKGRETFEVLWENSIGVTLTTDPPRAASLRVDLYDDRDPVYAAIEEIPASQIYDFLQHIAISCSNQAHIDIRVMTFDLVEFTAKWRIQNALQAAGLLSR